MKFRKAKSRGVAKERLKLMQESEGTPYTLEIMDQIQKEISDIILRYFDIAQDDFEIKVILKQDQKRA